MCARSDALGGDRADLSAFVTGRRPEITAVFLHGVYGSHWSWNLKGRLVDTARRLAAEGRIPSMVIVTPSDGLAGDGSGYLVDDGRDVERWVIDEAPAIAAEVLETEVGLPLALGGLSMGGYGALRLAGRHRSRVVAASAHSPIVRLVDHRLFGQRMPAAADPPQPDVVHALAGGAPALGSVRFDCGVDDPLIGSNRELHVALTELAVEHRFEEFPGGHSWAYWSTHVERSLRWFARQLR